MEVRPGYKQSEVGVIPEDWEAVRIGELFTFKNGLNKAKRFFGHGTPIVNYMDVFGRPGLRTEAIGGRVDVSPKELMAYEVRKGDVFFTRTSETVEEIGIAAVMLDKPEKTVYSGFVLRARPVDESLDDLFKAYCFSARYFRLQVMARASYTTRALTNGRSLSASHLARPPKREQRAIAAALSDVDALLGGLDRLIAKKRDLKQGAMQQLLTGQTRLPGFSGEWEVKRLGSIGEFCAGTYLALSQYRDGQYEVQGAGSVMGHHNVRNLPKALSVIGRVGTVGRPRFMPVGCWVNNNAAAIVAREPLGTPEFVHLLLLTVDWSKATSVTAQPFLVVPALMGMEFSVPEPDEQRAIAAVVSDMDAELIALEARRDKTRDLKQAMMQELLTGKTRHVPAGVANA